jgi:hypothetical protein
MEQNPKRLKEVGYEALLARAIEDGHNNEAIAIIANLRDAYLIRKLVEHTSRYITWWANWYGKPYRPAFIEGEKYVGKVRFIPVYQAIYFHLYGENDPDYLRIKFAQEHQIDYEKMQVLPAKPIDFCWMLFAKEYSKGEEPEMHLQFVTREVPGPTLTFLEDASMSIRDIEFGDADNEMSTKELQRTHLLKRTMDMMSLYFSEYIIGTDIGYRMGQLEPEHTVWFNAHVYDHLFTMIYRLLECGWFLGRVDEDQAVVETIRNPCIGCGIAESKFRVSGAPQETYCSNGCYKAFKKG